MRPIILYLYAILLPFWAFAQKGSTYRDSVRLNLVQPRPGYPLGGFGFGPKSPAQSARVPMQFCLETSDILTCTSDSIFNYDFLASQSTPIDTRIGEVDYWGESTVKVITSDWDSIFLHNGTNWYYSGHRYGSPDFIFIGAGKKYAYASNGVSLSRYDGNGQPMPIYSGYIGCLADLVVDRDEHVWLMTGQTWPYIEELRIIDSSGGVKCILPFEQTLYAVNGYGMTVIGDKAYIGFGNSNPIYPNSLVPLNLSDGMVKLGPPIPFIHSSLDLGTCNKNLPPPRCASSIEEIVDENIIDIWPNPVSDRLIVQNKSKVGVLRIQVFDVYHRCLADTYNTEIQCSNWAPGVYCVCAETGTHTTVKMIVKW